VSITWDRRTVAAAAAIGIVLILLAWQVLRDDSITLDPSLAAVTMTSCTPDGAEGTVENNADRHATPVIEVRFSGPDGVLIHKGSVTRPGMEAGEVKDWSIAYRGDLYESDETDITCDVDVPTLFKFSP
jgi:hypothetical protein